MPVHPGNLTSAYRRIWPEANYTGHDWDDVLGMYYAKARFYDPAAKRFVSMDPVKGNVTDPLSLVSYLYCVDNPLRYVDLDGAIPQEIKDIVMEQVNNAVIDFCESVLYSTSHFLDPVRQEDVGLGILAALIESAGESGAIILQSISNFGEKITGHLPTTTFYNQYLQTAEEVNKFFAKQAEYIDSYYLGKVIGNIFVAAAGIGMTYVGIQTLFTGVSASAGSVLSGVGVVATPAAIAVTAVGALEVGLGLTIATAAIGNINTDHNRFTNFEKLACEGRKNRPDKISLSDSQVGQKWGKHKSDYPSLKSHIEYRERAINIFKNPEKVYFNSAANEYYYISGKDLLRLKPDGTFISLYPGSSSIDFSVSTIIRIQ